MTMLSIWEKESFFAPADIVIAGSGLVGLWSAYYLKRSAPSLSITIVERGTIPTGASTRNAGFACFGSLTELVSNAQEMGEDAMLELVEMRCRGIRRIEKTFSHKKIGFQRNGGYELITGQGSLSTSSTPTSSASPGSSLITGTTDLNELRSRIDWLNRRLKKIVGEQKTFRLQNEKIDSFGFAGIQHLVENRAEGQLHSGRLCQALLALVQSMGVTVLNNIEIKGFEKMNGHLVLHTDQPFGLRASQLLVCTNAFARQLLPQLDVVPARGQVLVTSALERVPFKGTFHFHEGFYYFRDLGDRVLLGGARNIAMEEEVSEEMSITNTIQEELERFLRDTVLPGHHYTIEHRWSGIMGMGAEKMPILRPINDQVFCAVRMSGMGVALAPVMGEKIAAMMTGGPATT
ncbi:MAG TPA: FAD-dependent oxidoreductase [Puia sp.]|jgi:glycine/D-amino acid oxidase-like deaminating enzyme